MKCKYPPQNSVILDFPRPYNVFLLPPMLQRQMRAGSEILALYFLLQNYTSNLALRFA